MTPSKFDREHMSEILTDRLGEMDWYGAMLLRLIAHADSDNRELLRSIYPEHVKLYEDWLRSR